MNNPRGIAFFPTGELAVCDCDNSRVVIFSRDGTLITAFGTRGDQEGQFLSPVSVAVGYGDHAKIYVADSELNRIQVFEFLP